MKGVLRYMQTVLSRKPLLPQTLLTQALKIPLACSSKCKKKNEHSGQAAATPVENPHLCSTWAHTRSSLGISEHVSDRSRSKCCNATSSAAVIKKRTSPTTVPPKKQQGSESHQSHPYCHPFANIIRPCREGQVRGEKMHQGVFNAGNRLYTRRHNQRAAEQEGSTHSCTKKRMHSQQAGAQSCSSLCLF